MAKQTIISLVDDLDGSEAVETVEFGLDRKTYFIDLSDGNATKLREQLAPYIEAARRGGVAARPAPARGRTQEARPARADREHSLAVREWARSKGLQVSDRGRISRDVLEAYAAEHAA